MPLNTNDWSNVFFDEMPIPAEVLGVGHVAISPSTTSVIAHNRATTLKKTASPSAWGATTDYIWEASLSYREHALEAQEMDRLRYAVPTETGAVDPNPAPSTPTWVSSGRTDRVPLLRSALINLDINTSISGMWTDYSAVETRVIAAMDNDISSAQATNDAANFNGESYSSFIIDEAGEL